MYLKFIGTSDPVLIGFSVNPSQNRYYTCADWETAIFDVVITDRTNSFDILASRFTCPVTGVYMFTLTILNIDGYYARCDIMIESSQKAIVNSFDGSSTHNFNGASNSVIEECQAGQHAWVCPYCTEDYGAMSGRYVIFSGFLGCR